MGLCAVRNLHGGCILFAIKKSSVEILHAVYKNGVQCVLKNNFLCKRFAQPSKASFSLGKERLQMQN